VLYVVVTQFAGSGRKLFKYGSRYVSVIFGVHVYNVIPWSEFQSIGAAFNMKPNVQVNGPSCTAAHAAGKSPFLDAPSG
jgi:hypothetical protein